jgi:hypothetical protein
MADNTGHGLVSAGNRKYRLMTEDKFMKRIEDYAQREQDSAIIKSEVFVLEFTVKKQKHMDYELVF